MRRQVIRQPGSVLREFQMKPGFGFADYFPYMDRKALGAVEAKPGRTLTGVARAAPLGLRARESGGRTAAAGPRTSAPARPRVRLARPGVTPSGQKTVRRAGFRIRRTQFAPERFVLDAVLVDILDHAEHFPSRYGRGTPGGVCRVRPVYNRVNAETKLVRGSTCSRSSSLLFHCFSFAGAGRSAVLYDRPWDAGSEQLGDQFRLHAVLVQRHVDLAHSRRGHKLRYRRAHPADSGNRVAARDESNRSGELRAESRPMGHQVAILR